MIASYPHDRQIAVKSSARRWPPITVNRSIYSRASTSPASPRSAKSNPWFKRGTLFRSAVDVLRRSAVPMTAREIAETLIAGKAPEASRKQSKDLQAAILAALRKRDGAMVVGVGVPARWSLRASLSAELQSRVSATW